MADSKTDRMVVLMATIRLLVKNTPKLLRDQASTKFWSVGCVGKNCGGVSMMYTFAFRAVAIRKTSGRAARMAPPIRAPEIAALRTWPTVNTPPHAAGSGPAAD